jgi:hypothetical protein
MKLSVLLCIIGGILIIFSGINIFVKSVLAPAIPEFTQEQLSQFGLIYLLFSILIGIGVIGGVTFSYKYFSYKYGGLWTAGISLISLLIGTSLLNILGALFGLIGGVLHIVLVMKYYGGRSS